MILLQKETKRHYVSLSLEGLDFVVRLLKDEVPILEDRYEARDFDEALQEYETLAGSKTIAAIRDDNRVEKLKSIIEAFLKKKASFRDLKRALLL